MKSSLLRTLVGSVAALLLMGSAQAFAGPYSNTKYRVVISSGGNGMWHVQGAIGETYNVGDASYIVCSHAFPTFQTTCAAYDARSGIAVSCNLPRPIAPSNVGTCAPYDTSCRETTNTLLKGMQHGFIGGETTKFFHGMTPDTYVDFWANTNDSSCGSFTAIKGGYISPVVQ